MYWPVDLRNRRSQFRATPVTSTATSDATPFAEYLHDCVVDTVRRDLKEELGFVAVFDRAFATVRDIVDMPDRRASLFVRLCMQNAGRLSVAKRGQFAELADDEVAALEQAVQAAIRHEADEHPTL